MARGYPDFFSVPTYSSRGVYRVVDTPVVCLAGLTSVVATITSPGNMAPSRVLLDGVTDPTLVFIYFELDYVTRQIRSLYDLLRYGLIGEAESMESLLEYNRETNVFSVSFSPLINWGQYLRFFVQNDLGVNVATTPDIVYFQVI